MKYEAFISYRHGEIDEKVAVQVQKEIERYRVPGKIAKRIGKKRVGKVFRDTDELSASSDLSEIIQEALDESEWLIAICSKRYLESIWCRKEIEYFVGARGREKVLVILVDGEPGETFPRLLTETEVNGETVHVEPLAVDIRGESEHEILKNLDRERFRFLSTLLAVDYDDLRNRQRERRIRRAVASVSTVFVILAAVIGVIMVKNFELEKAYDDLDESNHELKKTNEELDRSNQETLRGESYYLAEYADQAFLEGDRETAIKLALAALPGDLDNPDRPYVPAAIRALTQATGVYDYTAGFHAGFARNRDELFFDVYTRFSEDGSTMLIETRAEQSNADFSREVEVYRVSDGERLCRYKEAKTNYNDFCIQSMAAFLSKDGKKLYYLSKTGLTCVDVTDGTEDFTAEAADDMRVDLSAGPGKTAIVTIDHKKGILYGYDLIGKKTLTLEVGSRINDMGAMDPDSGLLPIVTKRKSQPGILIVDINTGENTYCNGKTAIGNPVIFTGENRVFCRAEDPDGNITRLAEYDLKTGNLRYLYDSDWDVGSTEVALTDIGTCYTFKDNTVYEIDSKGDGNNVRWKHKLSSEVVSVCAGDGLVAVGCKDGSVSVFEEDGKKQIATPPGSGKPVFISSISQKTYVATDGKGKSVRVYNRQGKESHPDVEQGTIADVGKGEIPDYWYANNTQSDRFLFGMYQGTKQWLAGFDAESMGEIGECDVSYTGASAFEQVSYDCVSHEEYQEMEIHLYNPVMMKETYKADMDGKKYCFREDGEVLFLSTDDGTEVVETATGKVSEKIDPPDGFFWGVRVHDRLVYSSDEKVRIDGSDGKTERILDGVKLCKINENRGLIICSDKTEDNWYVYDVETGQKVFEREAGQYPYFVTFGDNRYVLMDYEAIYDMDTWERVLSLDPENGEVYGAATTATCPYFVVWCRRQNDEDSGLDIAVLYEKNGSGDPVGVIENYVALTPDNRIIAYDGEQTLYKFPLLSVSEIMEKAKQMVGDTGFTNEQKEKYHLFHN